MLGSYPRVVFPNPGATALAALTLFAAGFLLPVQSYLMALAGIVFLILALVVSKRILGRPQLGMSILVASSVAPGIISYGVQTIPVAILVVSFLTGLLLLELFLDKRKFWRFQSRLMVPLVLFMLVSFAAFLAGQAPWFSVPAAPLRAQLAGLAIFILSGCAFLVAWFQIRDRSQLTTLTWVFLAVGGVVVLNQFLALLTGRGIQFGFIGSVFYLWLISLAFAQALFNHSLPQVWRLALVALVLLTFYMRVFQMTSVSGWLPTGLSMGVILLMAAPRVAFVLGGLSLVVLLIFAGSVVEPLLAQESYSLNTRLEALRTILNVVEANPFLGVGPANYYFYTPLFPLMGWYVQFNTHNNYLDIIAQTGILGLACFLWFYGEISLLAWKLRSRFQGGFERAYVSASFGAIAGSLTLAALGDWLIPFVYNVGLKGFPSSMLGWFFLGGLAALSAEVKARRAPALKFR